MFRNITAFILMIAFTAQTFQRTAIILNYYSNQSAFAKNCENKARPMLHCNGKCQMMKKLRQQEKNDEQSPERKMENKNEVISSKSFFASLTFENVISIPSFETLFTSGRPVDQSYAIFHPPAV